MNEIKQRFEKFLGYKNKKELNFQAIEFLKKQFNFLIWNLKNEKKK